MARPVKRGPSPALVIVLVLVVLAIGGGAAVLVLRPQLPFGLSTDLPEVPKIEVPQELPFNLPWEQEPSGNEQGAGEADVTSVPAPSDGAVAPEAPAEGTEEAVAEEDGSVYATAPGEVIETEQDSVIDAPEPSVENAGVEQVEVAPSAVEEGVPSAPVETTPDIASSRPALVTPDL